MTSGTGTCDSAPSDGRPHAGSAPSDRATAGSASASTAPASPAALDHALAHAFALLSRLRRGRAVHGRGQAWHGELLVPGRRGAAWGTPLLDEPGSHAVLVRRSRALGLPSWLPDVTGVGIRVTDAGGSGRHQDLLLDTGGQSVVGRHVPFLHLSGHERYFSSLLAWRAGSGPVMFGARATGPLSMQLLLARPAGPWQDWATLALRERLTGDAADALHLSPANTGAGLAPVGWLQRLRPDSYAASARGVTGHL